MRFVQIGFENGSRWPFPFLLEPLLRQTNLTIRAVVEDFLPGQFQPGWGDGQIRQGVVNIVSSFATATANDHGMTSASRPPYAEWDRMATEKGLDKLDFSQRFIP